MKKKFAIVFLSLFLVVSLPFAAHANIVTATGKYLITAIKHIPGGAKVNATNTATGAKHAINHGVSAPALGAAIGGGLVGMAVGNGLGLAFQAITGLALDAVDWVMDEENNSIKWKKKGDTGSGGLDSTGSPVACPSYEGIGGVQGQGVDPVSACAAQTGSGWWGDPVAKYIGVISGKHTWNCGGTNAPDRDIGKIQCVGTPVPYVDVDADGYKKIPLVDLAKKVIDQADAGQVDSQKTIEDYVTNLAKEGKLDAELDAATDITPPEGTEPDDPTKPDDKECPLGSVLVDDVCVVKSDSDEALWCNSTDFSKKICDWIDWTQKKPDDLKSNEGKIDVIDKSDDLEIDEDRIVFADQCPPPTPIELVVMGFPYSEELNYQPFCDFFGMLNPFVVGMGGISSALIIAGGIRRG